MPKLYRWDEVNGSRQWVPQWAVVSNPSDIAGVCGNRVCNLERSKTKASCTCLPGTYKVVRDGQCYDNSSLVGNCNGKHENLTSQFRISAVQQTNYYFSKFFVIAYIDTSSTLFIKVRANGSWTSEGQAGGSNSSSDGMGSAKEKAVIIPTVLSMVVLIVLLSLLLLLIYEFMKNGSMDKWIFPSYQGRDRLLDWTSCLNIAIATAQGIAYFHEQCRDRIIHCDIKPENILVGENFCPKVSDFGLAKLMGREHSHVVQWLEALEIIGGRRNLDMSFGAEDFFYPGWAYKEMTNGSIIKVADMR
ncbi:hypothetical protein JHK82_055366 [Glycine max]|nr:hypothetical protein JHK82_055366 [Glycine max]